MPLFSRSSLSFRGRTDRQPASACGELWGALGPACHRPPHRRTHRTRSGAQSKATDTGGRRWPARRACHRGHRLRPRSASASDVVTRATSCADSVGPVRTKATESSHLSLSGPTRSLRKLRRRRVRGGDGGVAGLWQGLDPQLSGQGTPRSLRPPQTQPPSPASSGNFPPDPRGRRQDQEGRAGAHPTFLGRPHSTPCFSAVTPPVGKAWPQMGAPGE